MTKKPKPLKGMTTGYSARELTLYTDGERFAISRNEIERVVLTKEEMLKVLRLFAPYFNNHDFGLDDG